MQPAFQTPPATDTPADKIKRFFARIGTAYRRFEERLESRAQTPIGKEWVRYGSRIVFLFLTLIIFAFSFDRLFMPWYVGHNAVVRMPNVVGMSLGQAQRRLEQEGFTLKVASQHYNNSVPSGHIVNQMPFASSMVKTSRTVYLTVSRGRQMLEMPNLIGLTVRDARIALIRLGLSLNNVSYQFNERIPANIIFYQNVSSGERVNFGTRVDVAVSLGPEITYLVVPDVEGKSLEEARRILAASGFVIGEIISGDVNETFMPGTIIKQFPAPNDSVKSGTPVDLTVTR
jgi:serine/threonine-protein kinase